MTNAEKLYKAWKTEGREGILKVLREINKSKNNAPTESTNK